MEIKDFIQKTDSRKIMKKRKVVVLAQVYCATSGHKVVIVLRVLNGPISASFRFIFVLLTSQFKFN